MIMLLLLTIILELGLYRRSLWPYRRWSVGAVLVVSSYTHGLMVVQYFGTAIWILLFCQIFRVINLLRIALGRMHEDYLRKTATRSSLVIAGGTLIGLAVMGLELRAPTWFEGQRLLLILVVVQIIVATVLTGNTFRRVSRMTPKMPGDTSPIKDLPTVTVAIPARNETVSLTKLLDSIIASDYPKLEVLVYDDCSQDETGEVIKSYAQAGVRFLHGAEPQSNWVAKNQAYHELYKNASGELLLFCGADTRFGPQTITAMVGHMQATNKSMVSILPRHTTDRGLDGFIQPLRYWWQVAVPRRIFNRPAALSTCWMIRRDALRSLGGFRSVSQSVIPESYFARQLSKSSDGYSFLRTNGSLQVISEKPLADQFERALRVRYPEVHRRLELVMLIVVAEALLMVTPFVMVLVAVGLWWPAVAVGSGLAVVMLTATNMIILAISSRQRPLIAAVNFPIICLVEIVLGAASMLAYEFGTIDWKGRNVCLPAMHTTPNRRHGYNGAPRSAAK